jgi:predicted phosphodiesterase
MKPNFAFISDLHIRLDTPKCRTDDFVKTQVNKVLFIQELCNKHNIPLGVAGDIGQGPIKNWPPRLVTMAINLFSGFDRKAYAIPGQHDLPNHDIKRVGDSGFGALMASNSVIPLFNNKGTHEAKIVEVNGYRLGIVGFPYDVPIVDYEFEEEVDRKIALVHMMVIHSKKLWSQQTGHSLAQHLLRKFDYDLIVSGDNHLPFVVEYKDKVLVNCGSVSRQKSDQIDHRPRVYLYYAETNEVKPVYIPIDKDAVTDQFRQSEVEQDERMNKYVEALDMDYEVGLKFEENLENALDMNKDVPKSVKNKVWEAYESTRT